MCACHCVGASLSLCPYVCVTSSTKVFFNLECLPARVKACVAHLADEADAAASAALQPAALADATSAGLTSAATAAPGSPVPGGGGGATGSGSAAGAAGGGRAPSARDAGAAAARRRSARMSALAGRLAASLYSTSMEAWSLQRVLDKKRDPTTRALLDATVRGDRGAELGAGAYRAFWDGLCLAVRGAVERALLAEGVGGGAAGGGGYGGGGGGGGIGRGASGAALVSMYPFLRKAFLRLIRRLEDGTAARGAQGSRMGDGGLGGGAATGGAGGSAAATPGTGSAGATGSHGGAGASRGILGGSQWLSLALDSDDFGLSAEEEQERWGRRREGDVGGGAEAGAGPVGGGAGRAFGLRKRDRGGVEGGGGGGGAGGDKTSDSARLLEALGPLRDLFLARSLERLTTPVEQMFPQVGG